jgi:hypothetical protein
MTRIHILKHNIDLESNKKYNHNKNNHYKTNLPQLHYYITEILLKVALNTINQTKAYNMGSLY